MAIATCRTGCGACCIAPSISPCAALPDGKPAGVRCPHLTEELRCALFGRLERPSTCVGFLPELAVCGANRDDALVTLQRWELMTRPTC